MSLSSKPKKQSAKCFCIFIILFGISFAVGSAYMIISASLEGLGLPLPFEIIFAIPFVAGGGFVAFIGLKCLTSKTPVSVPVEEGVVAVGLPKYDEQYCQYCGTKIPFGDIKCPNCGAFVEQKSQ
ncbi:MAG: hypothetical protein ACTSYD_04385 [Candidatus Heimdallarchaeaceae archaeon]